MFNFNAGGGNEIESEKGPISQPSQDSTEEQHYEVDSVEPMVLLAPDAGMFIFFFLKSFPKLWVDYYR